MEKNVIHIIVECTSSVKISYEIIFSNKIDSIEYQLGDTLTSPEKFYECTIDYSVDQSIKNIDF